MEMRIEVAVTEGKSSKVRGDLLETLGKIVLTAMQYKVTEEVRLTGMEVDLLAEHKTTGQRIYVECKAYRNTLAADVIFKLLGQVEYKKVSSGWIITTSDFSKDGRGTILEWNDKPPDERYKLVFYTPDNLIDLLITTKTVIDPSKLNLPKVDIHNEATLLVTDSGIFWAISVLDSETRMPANVILYDAEKGNSISTEKLLKSVSKTDSTLSGLNWLIAEEVYKEKFSQTIKEEIDAVVQVTPGDSWDDYRPARPKDFVGRDLIQRRIFTFFDQVRTNQTNTRLMAIKSPSGMGKSSVLLKLASTCRNRRNRNKYYMYAVDCRAAVTNRYAEVALKLCLESAIKDGFILGEAENLTFGTSSNPFSDNSVKELLVKLREDNKVIILYFDQFEEIFSKENLFSLFKELSLLCNAVTSIQESVILGFAWKTDGTIPQEHPAYYLWQNTADHRKEFELTTFNKTEISNALIKFSQVIGQRLNPQLRTILLDHCQGYPWLLKKLSIHVYNLLGLGKEQVEILGRSMDIGELFERDLAGLTSDELACVETIASESPADYFKISNMYGENIINGIVGQKRLVVRSGPKLILYWDIFRDYVLTKKAPRITHGYIPQTQYSRFIKMLRLVLKEGPINVSEIGKRLNLESGTVDNMVRDLLMIGNADVNRKTGIVQSRQINEAEAANNILQFWRDHKIIRHLAILKGETFIVSQSEITIALKGIFPDSIFADRTWQTYTARIINWLKSLGLLVEYDDDYKYTNLTYLNELLAPTIRRTRVGSKIFLGEAPPARVLEVISLICKDRVDFKALGKYRNALYVIQSLGFNPKEDIKKLFANLDYSNRRMFLAKKILNAEIINFILDTIKNNDSINGLEIGDIVSSKFNLGWSRGSKIRNGNSIRKWALWAEDQADIAAQLDIG